MPDNAILRGEKVLSAKRAVALGGRPHAFFVCREPQGKRGGAALAARLTDPKRDSTFIQGTIRSCCTVLIMCPTMSLVASILFNVILAGMPVAQLPAIWVGTLIKNFPMALLWNLFAAGPISRLVFAKCFSHVGESKAEKNADAASLQAESGSEM